MTQTGSSAQPELTLISISQKELQDQARLTLPLVILLSIYILNGSILEITHHCPKM